jgi:hydroxyacylglutathione hydrolase
MIRYEVLVLGELQTNCYLVWDENSKEAVVIDAADDGIIISEEIEKRGLKLKYILATHGHFDHNLGVLDLKLIYNVPYCASDNDLFLLKRQQETAKYFLKKEIKTPNLKKIDINLDKENEVIFGEQVFEIVETPGHTPGSVCFYNKENKFLFSGDTLFKDCRGRTDFEYGSTENIFKSLKKIMKLPQNTVVLSGHGKETTIGNEKSKYNLKI